MITTTKQPANRRNTKPVRTNQTTSQSTGSNSVWDDHFAITVAI